MALTEQYAFGDFVLDVEERRLVKDGRPIRLAPKAHDLLVALVSRAGHLLTKDELLKAVWPESFVEEGILAVHVSALRKALGSALDGPPHIETVAGSGYRFASPVSRTTPAPNVTSGRATHPEIHELVGRGRAHLLSASSTEAPLAVAAFDAAVALDPEYAPAHAGLARAWCAMAQLRQAPLADAFARAKASALSALAMDSTSADALIALATVLFLGEWNWAAAEKSLARALTLNPGLTEGYLLYGQLKEALGQLEQGLALKLRALERDPASPLVHLQISHAYFNQRRYDDAILWANKALALDPRHTAAREYIAAAYLKKGDIDRYVTENIAHAESHGMPAEALEPMLQVFAREGRAGVVRLAIQQLLQANHSAAALGLAVHYAEAGDLDDAFLHLERAIASRDPGLVHLAVGPQWDPLRGDPRFEMCLKRMGLL